MKKKNGCIIEDDLSFGSYLYARLSDMGCHFKLIETFDQGEAFVDEHVHHLDLAIIQTQLKGGSGVDIAHYIRELNPETGVILLTAQDNIVQLAKLLKIPNKQIFQMPFFPLRDLRETVQSLLLRLPAE